jgi:hypothetical protein
MQPGDFLKFQEHMYVLGHTYKTDGGQIGKMYFKSLVRLTVEQVEQGIVRWLQDPKKCAYLPKPGDLLAYFPEDKTTQTQVQTCVECKELPSEMTNAGKALCMDCYHIHFWRPRAEYEIQFLNAKCRAVWEKRLKDRILPG